MKRALERLFEEEPTPVGMSAAARRFVGSDKRTGNVARNAKRLLRQHLRAK